MLELRPNCECCDESLPPDSKYAVICTFECTFCVACAKNILNFQCPNCAGNLAERPIRPKTLLESCPASNKRVLKQDGCIALSK